MNKITSWFGKCKVPHYSEENFTKAKCYKKCIRLYTTTTNTTYSAGTGISITNNTINHTNSVTAATASEEVRLKH